MIDLEPLKAQLLRECQDDHVGLWSVIWSIRGAMNNGENPLPQNDRSDPKEVRCLSLRLVDELLKTGQIQAGFPTPDGRGFRGWQLPSEQTLSRIQAEWERLGRDPTIGEVVWFTADEALARS